MVKKRAIETKCRKARKELNNAMVSFYEAKNTGELTEKQADRIAKMIAHIMSVSSKICRKFE